MSSPTDEQRLRYRELDNAVRIAAIQAAKEAAIAGAPEDFVTLLMRPALMDYDRVSESLSKAHADAANAQTIASNLRTELHREKAGARELLQDQERLLDALRLCAKGRGAAAVLARAEIKRIGDKEIPF